MNIQQTQSNPNQSKKIALMCQSGAFAMILALTACGSGHEHVAAVDKVDEASAAAREAAPAAVLDEPATVTSSASDTAEPVDPATTDAATNDTATTDTTTDAVTTEDTAVAEDVDVQAVAAGAGKDLYESKCSVCHNAGVAGAPKLDDAAAWQPRLAQGQDVLYQSVINGKGAMPPRATANDATDAELKAAVDYMTATVIK